MKPENSNGAVFLTGFGVFLMRGAGCVTTLRIPRYTGGGKDPNPQNISPMSILVCDNLERRYDRVLPEDQQYATCIYSGTYNSQKLFIPERLPEAILRLPDQQYEYICNGISYCTIIRGIGATLEQIQKLG